MKIHTAYLYCIISITFFLQGFVLQAQRISYWTNISNIDVHKKSYGSDNKTIKEYQLYKLDHTSFFDQLARTASSAKSRGSNSDIIMSFPSFDGSLTKFKLYNKTVLSPGLATKFSSIGNYRGVAINDNSLRVRLTYNSNGITVTLFQGTEVASLEQLSTPETYMLYNKRDVVRKEGEVFKCNSKPNNILRKSIGPKKMASASKEAANDEKLRTIRLAIATTGEYSQYFIRKNNASTESEERQKEIVLTAVAKTIGVMNELYESEFAVTFQLVAGLEQTIFLDPDTDEMNNNDSAQLRADSQRTLDARIGAENYDMGHTFSTGAGGEAIIASICSNSARAQGVTGFQPPEGPEFDIDFVAHEFGHQFGANHVQGNDDQREPTSVEPGSGSTIMGYAGISDPNIQEDSDSYFNAVNIREVMQFLKQGLPFQTLCGVAATPLSNSAPVVEENDIKEYGIPKGTPFVLQIDASDADGDNLTYCWEQQDGIPSRGTVIPMPPESTNEIGALFRSLPPQEQSARFFPQYESVLNGDMRTEWEVLPEVERELNFTVTVRDNNDEGGQNVLSDVRLNVADVGPFKVLSQNEIGLKYNKRKIFTVEWDVAGTNSNAVNTDRVNILLSYDGGPNFRRNVDS